MPDFPIPREWVAATIIVRFMLGVVILGFRWFLVVVGGVVRLVRGNSFSLFF